MRKKLFASNENAEPQVFSPAITTISLRDGYSEGVLLFRQRKYEDALATFSSLLDKGIEETLADHCEYWKGECHFAQHEYALAMSDFQKGTYDQFIEKNRMCTLCLADRMSKLVIWPKLAGRTKN